MLVFRHSESARDQFGLNGRKFRGHHHDIGVHRKHGLDIAVNSKPADQAREYWTKYLNALAEWVDRHAKAQ